MALYHFTDARNIESKTGLQKDGAAKVETGIKFHAIYKLFQKNKIEVARYRNKYS